MSKLLPLVLAGITIFSSAFAEYTEIFELIHENDSSTIRLKPAHGSSMERAVSTILEHKFKKWENGLHKLETSHPFLVKDEAGEFFCITHYIAGQTADIRNRRRSFDLTILNKSDSIPLTLVGMRQDQFLEELRFSAMLPPIIQNITPSKISSTKSPTRAIENVSNPYSFTLLTIPFTNLRRHSTGMCKYPRSSMVWLPDPMNRSSRVCEGCINESESPSKIEMPRTSLAFVIRPWDEVKYLYPSDSEVSDLKKSSLSNGTRHESKGQPGKKKAISEKVTLTKRSRELSVSDVLDGMSSKLGSSPSLSSSVRRDFGLSEDENFPTLLTSYYTVHSTTKQDMVTKFLYECYENNIDQTQAAGLIESALNKIFTLTPKTSRQIRLRNSPIKTRRNSDSPSKVLVFDEEFTPIHYLDPRSIPERVIIAAAALMKASGKEEKLQRSSNVLARLYSIPVTQATAVINGISMLDQLHDYEEFIAATLRKTSFFHEGGSFGITGQIQQHFGIPLECAQGLYLDSTAKTFTRVEDSLGPKEKSEKKESLKLEKVEKAVFDPLNPDKSFIELAKCYDESSLSDYFKEEGSFFGDERAQESASLFVAAQVMHIVHEQPFTQMFALMGGVKFKGQNIVYKSTVKELLRARNFYKVPEGIAKEPILEALMNIFEVNKDQAKEIYKMVPNLPLFESNNTTFAAPDLWGLRVLQHDSTKELEQFVKPIHELHKVFVRLTNGVESKLQLTYSLQRILHLKWLDAYKLIPND